MHAPCLQLCRETLKGKYCSLHLAAAGGCCHQYVEARVVQLASGQMVEDGCWVGGCWLKQMSTEQRSSRPQHHMPEALALHCVEVAEGALKDRTEAGWQVSHTAQQARARRWVWQR